MPASPPSIQRSATTRIPNKDAPKQPLPYQPQRPGIPLDESGSRDAFEDEEEEEDMGAYERVDEYLIRDPSGAVIGVQPTKSTPPRAVHDYTPVKVTDDGDVRVGEEEHTPPLKSSPQPKKRSSVKERSPSAPHIHHLSTSPSAATLMIPPEPSSPPPSPPTSHRTPPTPARGLESTDSGEQPRLPPKKRNKAYVEQNVSRWASKMPPPVQVRERERGPGVRGQGCLVSHSTGGECVWV